MLTGFFVARVIEKEDEPAGLGAVSKAAGTLTGLGIETSVFRHIGE